MKRGNQSAKEKKNFTENFAFFRESFRSLGNPNDARKNYISNKDKIKNHGVLVLAEQIAQLDVDDAEKSSYIAVQLIQALTEARSFNQLSSNLQVGNILCFQ